MYKLLALASILFLPFQSSFARSIETMSLEEKVGQLLMVHFHGEVANEEAKILIQELKVGGIIYYAWANGLNSPEQVKTLSDSLSKLASIPLLIAVDQEGGRVIRIKGLTAQPGNGALGLRGDPAFVEQTAFLTGQELKALGITLNLAPVVDINSNPCNTVIGDRSFGEDPEKVTELAKSTLQGYHRAGLLTSLKHFPGHGDVQIDSHEDLPVLKKSKAELDKCELIPFKKLAAQSDTIMTAHILLPALDENNCATLSKKILNLLRHEMNFEGVILSDSLVMKGVLKNCSIDNVVIRAVKAGCDILLLGGKLLNGTHAEEELTVCDIQRIHKVLVEAVKAGQISPERLNEAVKRILNLKERAKHCS